MRDRKLLFCILLLTFWMLRCYAATPFVLKMVDERVASLSVSVGNASGTIERRYPYYAPSEGEWLAVSFDLLDGYPEELGYTLLYCDADWVPQEVPQGAVAEGFSEGILPASLPSEMTQTTYRHYTLRLDASSSPKPRLSGNWLLRIHPRGMPGNIYIEAGFALLERHWTLSAEVSPLTPKGDYAAYQSVACVAQTKEESLLAPDKPFRLFVGQNARRDNTVFLTEPSFRSPSELRYEHQCAAVFEAGNEYRAFELLSAEQSNMGVQHLIKGDPEVARLVPAYNRKDAAYTTDRDANGQFVVRAPFRSYDAATTADYYEVRFTFVSPQVTKGIFLLGDAFEALPKEERNLHYNVAGQCYEAALLLKAGYYSFLYATDEEGVFSTRETEGSHYQTENAYTLLLYRQNEVPIPHYALVGAVEYNPTER